MAPWFANYFCWRRKTASCRDESRVNRRTFCVTIRSSVSKWMLTIQIEGCQRASDGRRPTVDSLFYLCDRVARSSFTLSTATAASVAAPELNSRPTIIGCAQNGYSQPRPDETEAFTYSFGELRFTVAEYGDGSSAFSSHFLFHQLLSTPPAALFSARCFWDGK